MNAIVAANASPRSWAIVVCAATGPSFSLEQADLITAAQLNGLCRVIAINDNWRRLPSADILFAPDRSWWKLHVASIRASRFSGELLTVHEKAAQRYGLRHVKHKHGLGLHSAPDTINCGGNSGYMAICLAYLAGARQVILVGYDMAKAPDGKTHWFGNHPAPLSNSSPYPTFVKRFQPLAADLRKAGVSVTNCSARSALDCFPRADLADSIAALEVVK